MKPYSFSLDLRERVIKAYDQKVGAQAKVAKIFGVSVPWIKKLLRQRRETGSLAPRPHGGGRQAAFDGKNLEELKELVGQNPDATLRELGELSGVKCGVMAVWRTLKKLGCRRKKSHFTLRSKTDRTSGRSVKSGGRRQPERN